MLTQAAAEKKTFIFYFFIFCEELRARRGFKETSQHADSLSTTSYDCYEFHSSNLSACVCVVCVCGPATPASTNSVKQECVWGRVLAGIVFTCFSAELCWRFAGLVDDEDEEMVEFSSPALQNTKPYQVCLVSFLVQIS